MHIIEGQIEHISEVETFNKKEEKKIDVVITTKNDLTNRREYVKVEFMREHVKVITENFFEIGDLVTISYQLVGRKFNKDGVNMYFNNVQGLTISHL